MDNRNRLGMAAGLSLFWLACTDARPLANEPSCVGWVDGVALDDQSQPVSRGNGVGTLLEDKCGKCHAGAEAAGGFSVTSYENVLTHLRAGDPNSVLLRTLDPTTASPAHAQVAKAIYNDLSDWVVTCKAAYVSGGVHEGGIQDQSQPGFHGRLAASGLTTCRTCHGAKLDADLGQHVRTVRSCVTCHAGFSDTGTGGNCSTCHATPPTSGAHPQHLGSSLVGLACTDCHPQRTDGSHATDAAGNRRTTAQVVFAASSLAASGNNEAAPTWDPESKTCNNVYCHGATLGDAASVTTSPRWTDTRGAAQGCTYCHGVPPRDGSHPPTPTKVTDCHRCHRFTADSAGAILAGGKHMNGAIDVP